MESRTGLVEWDPFTSYRVNSGTEGGEEGGKRRRCYYKSFSFRIVQRRDDLCISREMIMSVLTKTTIRTGRV